jgi:4-alpha-glucanotransferase
LSHFARASGVLLHITSLPGEFGIGDLGHSAYRFVDFLVQAGQHIWQILPLGPTTLGDSPYSSYSAFAGNPLLISPQRLVESGFLTESEVQPFRRVGQTCHLADYEAAKASRSELLRQAFKRFSEQQAGQASDEFSEFCHAHRWWLEDFALFSALMHQFGTDEWCSWDPGLVAREPQTLERYRQQLAEQIEYAQFVQFLFHRQWQSLKHYAAEHDVKLFGDMPIFVAHGSADVWANQDIFWLDSKGKPKVVAGVPPDYFSKTGQLWGNPLYNWRALAATDYDWWTRRFRRAFELYDMLRIDHFRGFESYWEVPATAKTAVAGRWVPGPGAAPFEAAERALGELPIVAEDLGMITEAVHELRDQLDFPGMRVLQFGFDAEHDTFHRPESFPINCAAYTGTHDNSTIVGWYLERQEDKTQDILDRYLQDPGQSGMPIHWQLISMVLRSRADIAIIPLQDILGLDNTARMNVPGLAYGNWRWRFQVDDLTDEIVDRLRVISVASDR